MAAHGHPRFTKDLDVWVWMDPANGAAVMAALDEFGFGSLGLTVADDPLDFVLATTGRIDPALIGLDSAFNVDADDVDASDGTQA